MAAFPSPPKSPVAPPLSPGATCPTTCVERTKQCLLDWFAVTVAGAQEELTDILVREALEDGAKGPATLVGRSETVLPSAAALINGAASHALDYDDVNFAMGGHPTVTVVPALLALGEQIEAPRASCSSRASSPATKPRAGSAAWCRPATTRRASTSPAPWAPSRRPPRPAACWA